MNIFRDVLEEIQKKVDGAYCMMIVGVDGIIIDRSIRPGTSEPEVSFDLIAAEYTSLLKTAMRTADDVQTGMLQEMTVFTEMFQFVIKMITEEYYLIIILANDGNYGRARYELKKAKMILEKEFEI